MSVLAFLYVHTLLVVAHFGLLTISNATPPSAPIGVTLWHAPAGDSIIIETQYDESKLKTVKIKNFSASTTIRVRRKNRGDLHWSDWVTVNPGSLHAFSDVANATYFEVEDVDANDGSSSGSVIVR